MDQPRFRIRFVADNDEKRTRGLMFAEPLEDDEAVLFVFPYADRYGFWNKNVSFGLSLAFCDDQGRIVHLADMNPDDPTRVEPQTDDVRFVVEVKRGAFAKLGVVKGDLIEYADNNLRIRKVQGRNAQKHENSIFQKTAMQTQGVDWKKLEENLLAGSLEEDNN
jgi:uncharacterized membrane protein (UPF0127 family)